MSRRRPRPIRCRIAWRVANQEGGEQNGTNQKTGGDPRAWCAPMRVHVYITHCRQQVFLLFSGIHRPHKQTTPNACIYETKIGKIKHFYTLRFKIELPRLSFILKGYSLMRF
jgi:hypothetical protein